VCDELIYVDLSQDMLTRGAVATRAARRSVFAGDSVDGSVSALLQKRFCFGEPILQ
jgi:hypothetical protein